MKKKVKEEVTSNIEINNKFNIVGLLLLDHNYLKQCIKILKDQDEKKSVKLKYAKSFIDALKKHTIAEEQSVYNPLIKVEDLKMEILEGQSEHDVCDWQVAEIEPQLKGIRAMSDELEMKVKVLAELVDHHLEEEEEKMFPKIKKDLDKEIQNEMGYQFMKIRKFAKKDLEKYPKLQQELNIVNRLASNTISGDFSERVRQHVIKAA